MIQKLPKYKLRENKRKVQLTATKEVATIKFSSLGKKAVAAVIATTQAFGFIN